MSGLSPDSFVYPDRQHEYSREKNKSDNAPKHTERVFQDYQEHNAEQEKCSYLVPHPKLGGGVGYNAFLLLTEYAVAKKMVNIKPNYKADFPDKPRRNAAIKVQHGRSENKG